MSQAEIMIGFTPQEAQFIAENIANLTVPLKAPDAELIASLGRSVIRKLETAAMELASQASPLRAVETPPITEETGSSEKQIEAAAG